MLRKILKLGNWMISLVVILTLSATGIYAGYALWDNGRIYAEAENVQADMRKRKPVIEEPQEQKASFEELLSINPDVCAWVSLDQTKIDHPVLQGETNLTYINQDVYGEFSLAGSIYLDTRNAGDLSDPYNLLYGHHMENGGMFGDLDRYEEEKFFKENSTGMLILPDRAYQLEIFSCLLVRAGEPMIFDPERWEQDLSELFAFAEENSLCFRKETMDKLEQEEAPQILALSTCSSAFTDARTIILAVMEPYQTAD